MPRFRTRRMGSGKGGYLLACGLAAVVFSSGCGSTGGESNPKLPVVVIDVEELIIDVGQEFELSGANSTDPEGNDGDIGYFWTGLNATSLVIFDSRCEDDVSQTCDENSDDLCAQAQVRACATNADCAVGNCDSSTDECEELQNQFCNRDSDCAEGPCNFNSGTSSPDCAEGICLLGEGSEQSLASFTARAPGPYEIRLLIEGNKSNNIGLRTLQTYPSLYVLGSLIGFGGTAGGLIGESASAEKFAADAVRGVSSPDTGNLLLADPVVGSVREFDFRTTDIVGTFGETDKTTAPVALAFDRLRDLYVANQDGTVQIFDGATGLFAGNFSDVTVAGEEVTAILFEPTNDNLLVVDGRAGQGLREFDTETGLFLGFYGETAAAVAQATDAAFLSEEDGGNLLIADGFGDVKICDADGTSCGSFGTVSSLLAVGGPTAVAVNPSAEYVPEAAVMVADRSSAYVVACTATGDACEVFGDTEDLDSEYLDVFFSPPQTPVPDTTTTSTTSTTLPSD